MNERQKQILEMLKNTNKWIKSTELASLFHVTARTIRSDITKINKEFKEEIILSHSHYGYSINIQKSSHASHAEEHSDFPETPLQRAKHILKMLLLTKEPINLVLLQNTLFTSLSTLEKDVHKVRKILETYPNLVLEKKGDTITLQGDEFYRRKLYKDLLSKEVTDDFLNMNKLAKIYHSFDFIRVADILDERLKVHQYHIREVSLSIVMVHIGIAIERIMQRKYVTNVQLTNNIEDTIEYVIATEFYEQLKQEMMITVPEEEVQLLALLLLGKRSMMYQNDEVTIHENKVSIQATTLEIVNEIYRRFDIDLAHDEELKSGLNAHLQSYAYRLKAHEKVKNVFLPEVKKQYPLVFEMGIIAARVLKKDWLIDANEDEIGFLSIHLGSAYERISKDQRIKGVLIYPHNASFSHVCEEKINARFSQQLEIVKSFSLFDETKILKYEPDIILTTVPIEHSLSIPTLQISLFITLEDESMIFQLLNSIQKRSMYLTAASKLEQIIRPDFFFLDMEASTPQEVIHTITKKAVLQGIVPIGFEEDVNKREEISSTSFVYGFATPHAMSMMANESIISVVLLKKPITWGEYPVSLVFLLALKEEDQDILRFFFEWFAKIIDKKDIMQQLMNAKDYETFMNKIIHMEEIYEQ